MNKTISFIVVMLVFVYIANIYVYDTDLQIAAAIHQDVTIYYARKYIAPFVAIAALAISCIWIYKIKKENASFLFLIMPFLVLMATPPVVSGGEYFDVLSKLVGEFGVLLVVFHLFPMKEFDRYFLTFAILFLTISSAGCAAQSPYFLMSASHEYGCRGLTSHRNTFAPQVNFLLIYLCAILNIKGVKKYSLVILLGLLGYSTKSVGFIAVFRFILFMIALRDILLRMKYEKIRISVIYYPVLLYGAVLSYLLFSAVTELFGREESYTDRLDIYGAATYMFKYIIWGEGYKSVISDELRSVLVMATGWEDAAGMHNSILELWRQIGLIPTVFTGVLVAFYIAKNMKGAQLKDKMPFFAALAIASYVINGLWESQFGPYNSLMSLVCFRLFYLVHRERNAHKVVQNSIGFARAAAGTDNSSRLALLSQPDTRSYTVEASVFESPSDRRSSKTKGY